MTLITDTADTEPPAAHDLLQIPVAVDCTTAAQRAAREAATQALFRRAAQAQPGQHDGLLTQIVELNLEIARGLARRFRDRGAEADDLEQVAMLGLVKAVHNYRLDAGTPFIGFAIPTIRGEIKRYFRDCAWTIRIPRRLQDLQTKIAAKAPALAQRLQREPTPAELATELGEPQADITAALTANGCFNTLSLDHPTGPASSDLVLADVVADTEDPALQQLETIEVLQPVLNELDDRDRTVLYLRFIEGWTQKRIGAQIGISQVQVSRLLKNLFTDLRTRIQAPTAA